MCIFTGAFFISVKKEKHSKYPPPGEGMNTVKPVSLRASSPSSRGVESGDRPQSGRPRPLCRVTEKPTYSMPAGIWKIQKRAYKEETSGVRARDKNGTGAQSL